MMTRAELTKWTDALRANPEQQYTLSLANKDYTKFCCLGKLCEVMGIERWVDGGYRGDQGDSSGYLPEGKPAKWFGSRSGDFGALKMPELVYNEEIFDTAAAANDSCVPWPVIAEHFDKYYPCEDEHA